MVRYTKGTGNLVKRTAKVVLSTQMAMFMLDNGRKIKLRASESTHTKMVLVMKVSGKKTNSMEKV